MQVDVQPFAAIYSMTPRTSGVALSVASVDAQTSLSTTPRYILKRVRRKLVAPVAMLNLSDNSTCIRERFPTSFRYKYRDLRLSLGGLHGARTRRDCNPERNQHAGADTYKIIHLVYK